MSDPAGQARRRHREPPPGEASATGKTGGPADTGAGGGKEGFAMGTSVTPALPPNRAPAYIAWAFGGAAVAVGAGFGAVAIKGKNDLEGKCTNNQCQPS